MAAPTNNKSAAAVEVPFASADSASSSHQEVAYTDTEVAYTRMHTTTQLALIDVVNPRLVRYPHGPAIAFAIIVLQLGIVGAAVYYFRSASLELVYKVDESQDMWSNVHNDFKVCASLDETTVDKHSAFAHACLVAGASSCEDYDCMGMTPVYYPHKDATDTKKDEGPSHWGSDFHCSKTLCKPFQLVRVVYARRESWITCLSKALSFVGSSEMVVTGLVLLPYMWFTRGPAWMAETKEWGEWWKVAIQARPSIIDEEMHAGK